MHALDGGGLRCVLGWQDHGFEAVGGGGERDVDRATNRTQFALEREFTGTHDLIQRLERNHALGGEDAQGNRQVKTRAFLANVRRGEIDRNFSERKLVRRILDRRPHPISGLLNGGIAQANHGKIRHSTGNVHLNLNDSGFYSDHGRGEDFGKHPASIGGAGARVGSGVTVGISLGAVVRVLLRRVKSHPSPNHEHQHPQTRRVYRPCRR